MSGVDGSGMPVHEGNQQFAKGWEGTYGSSIAYAATPQTYTWHIVNSNDEYSFGSGDLVSTSDQIYRFRKTAADGSTVTFDVENPAPGFAYARSASLDEALSSGGLGGEASVPRRRAFCVMGVPTDPNDRPSQVNVNFTTFAIRGTIYDRRSGKANIYHIDGGTAALSVSLQTGVTTGSLSLHGSDGSGHSVTVGPYALNASISEADATFAGSFTDGANDVGITGVSGAFLGPKGKEFAYMFSQYRYGPGSGTFDLVVFGTVLGKR